MVFLMLDQIIQRFCRTNRFLRLEVTALSCYLIGHFFSGCFFEITFVVVSKRSLRVRKLPKVSMLIPRKYLEYYGIAANRIAENRIKYPFGSGGLPQASEA